MSEVRNLICIGCPIGCDMEVTLEEGKVTEVKGNTCVRGKNYAEKECTNPTRIVTSSVRVQGGEIDSVSVKTQSDIPKNKIMQCIEELKGITVNAPIKAGEVIIRNVADTGVSIISTKTVEIRN
ncbi:hypothetical protein CLHOM_34250 [Clostridium homopropionicum DSM 5847]|uniref:4Fe-4S Mo/W bis-MGD-type domain-containing protein n=1 Tax=Clostridium homopropionicum DSM 5847 TaxID=1121318 RepID=A0A0L6Z6S4_9CLOT|nr:DUF1667 domain-containing protein [Clostridium homopropionicum]KOA18523.1 hypothetical protein CLHOM_34250 [Clostridium homopropionicum DSM 5847]SFF65419.1 CxxC motif-containing protein [Clostridium homopropionicum]